MPALWEYDVAPDVHRQAARREVRMVLARVLGSSVRHGHEGRRLVDCGGGRAAMIRLYTASNLRHAEKWRALCAESRHVQCHARWLKHSAMGTPDTAEHAAEFWPQDEQDVRDADAVLVYAEDGDQLRGALVEAGIAIAAGIPVIVVGDHPDYGTWQHHPGVMRVRSLEAAMRKLEAMRPRYRR
jgi:nucleoside 2-deoxyribosyltransferase